MSMDSDIFGLEAKVVRVKADYEQYFMGILKREPLLLRKEIEQTILHYTNIPINNTSLKFKFSTTVAKFTSYKLYWKRTLRMIEEGTYQRRAEGGAKISPPPPPPTKKPAAETAGTSGKTDFKDAFDKYLTSREKCGQSTKGVTLEKFQRSISAQQKKLGTEGKSLKVFIKDGKTKVAFTSAKPEGK